MWKGKETYLLEEIGEELKELCIWFPFFCHLLDFFYLSLSLSAFFSIICFFFWETSNLVPDVYNNDQLGPKAIGLCSVIISTLKRPKHEVYSRLKLNFYIEEISFYWIKYTLNKVKREPLQWWSMHESVPCPIQLMKLITVNTNW